MSEKKPADPAGYSGTPLPKKLGLAAGQIVKLGNAPADWAQTVAPLPDGLQLVASGPYTFGHWFVRHQAELFAGAQAWANDLQRGGMLWVSWQKKSARVRGAADDLGDMHEEAVRQAFLPLGLVDIKVCAFDATWSALKLVWRKSS